MAYAFILLMLIIGCIVSGVMALAKSTANPRDMRGARMHHGHGHSQTRARARYEQLRGMKEHDFSGRNSYDQYDDARRHRYERAREEADDGQPPIWTKPKKPEWCIVLGIEQTASQKDMRAAYARLMRSLHPDVAPQNAMTSQRCAIAAEAYEQAREYAKAQGTA